MRQIFIAIVYGLLVLPSFQVQTTEVKSTIMYIPRSTTRICVKPIDTNNCPNPALKLRCYQDPSTRLFRLIFNKLFFPDGDKVVLRLNTSECGFKNVTSQRNETHLCVNLIDVLSNLEKSKLRLQLICGVTNVTKERYLWFTFESGSQPYAPTKVESTPGPYAPTKVESTPEKKRSGLSGAEKVGIAVACVIAVVIIVALCMLVRWLLRKMPTNQCYRNNNERK